MRLIFTTITLCLFTCLYGQNSNDASKKLLSSIENEMTSGDIATFFVVQHEYLGLLLMNSKDCDSKTHIVMYAFWEDKEGAWIKKYDNCGGFLKIKLGDLAPMEYYKNKYESLKKEDVKSYTTKPDSIVNGMRYSFVTQQSHSPMRRFWFYKPSQFYSKWFDKFNLTTEKDSPNIYFEYNNDLAIVHLNDICEEIINNLNEENRFSR